MRYLIALTICTVALIGCGSSSTANSPKTAEAALAVYKQVLDLVSTHKYAETCALYTAKEQAHIGDGNADQCAANIAIAVSMFGIKKNTDEVLKGVKVKVDGNTATLTSSKGTEAVVTYVDGKWLVSKS